MSGRVTGYHYVTGSDGKKHRVYPQGAKKVWKGNRSMVPYNAKALRGKGGYYDSSFVKSMSKNVPKGTFKEFGTQIAGPLGGALGAQLAKFAGFGSYTVKRNTMLDEGQSPAMMHSSSSTLRVRHREYIADVVSSGTANEFTSTSYPINPGLSDSFPWLAPIAQQYEQYKVLGMVYEFKTLSADAVASSQANMTIGGVIMATDYNSINPAFINKQQMDNTEYTTSCKPSVSFYHPIECAPNSLAQGQYFTRSSAPPSNADLRLYDVGNFQIGSFGIAAASVVLGELWVSYEIEFSKPILIQQTLGQDVLSDHFWLDNTTLTSSAPLSTAPTTVPTNSLGGNITSGYQYNFSKLVQSGEQYLINYIVSYSSAVSTVAPSLQLENCTLTDTFAGGGAPQIQNPGSSATQLVMQYTGVVTIGASSATPYIRFVSATVGSGVASGDLIITQLPNEFD